MDYVDQPVVKVLYQTTYTATRIANDLATAIRRRMDVIRPDIANSPLITAIPDPDPNENFVNDLLATAINLNLPGAGATARGVDLSIGDVANPASRDVDMYRIDMTPNQTIAVRLTASNATPGFRPVLRLFDSQGVEVLRGQLDLSGNTVLNFTSLTQQSYYLGVSGGSLGAIPGNTSYSPTSAPATRSPGTSGRFDLEVVATRPYNILTADDEVILSGSTNIALAVGTQLKLEGGDGFLGIPVSISRGMSASQVASQVAAALNGTLSGGIADAFSSFGPNVRLEGATIQSYGPLKPLVRAGDAFAEPTVASALQNNFEGVYLDDFIIGFAERGELGTGAAALDNFQASNAPNLTSPVLPAQPTVAGTYQIEIRDGSEYIQSDIPVVATATMFRGFDTNDRLDAGVTITPATGDVIRQYEDSTGAQPKIPVSDGVRQVVLEFVDLNRIEAQLQAVGIRLDQVTLRILSDMGFVASGSVPVPTIQAALTTPALPCQIHPLWWPRASYGRSKILR